MAPLTAMETLALDASGGGNGIVVLIERGGDGAQYWPLQHWHCAVVVMEVFAQVAVINTNDGVHRH